MPKTSVIIPAYRARGTLPILLDALATQLGQEREAILVESGADESRRDLGREWPWLRVISLPDRALPGRARNVGAGEAFGELLAFLDADAIPESNWLNRLEEGLTDEADAVAGGVLNGTPTSRVGIAEYLLEFSEVLPRPRRPLRHAPSCNLLVRRSRFEHVGGFPEELRAGEDTVFTFPMAASGRLAFAPEAAVSHLNRTQLGPFLANQRLLGAAFTQICDRVPYPHGWVSRFPGLLLAGPLRLAAIVRCLADHRPEVGPAVRAAPQLLMGIVAWVVGAMEARVRTKSKRAFILRCRSRSVRSRFGGSEDTS